jgi:putative tricarboxylic transport membrane protein
MDLWVLLSILVGSVAGIVVGVLPGIGPGVAIAVLLPLTYGMSPLAGISVLLGIYCGAFYGGAVTSILIRTPGEASSIMTMFDGYPMAKRGEPERALSLAFSSSFVGGIFSAVALALAAPWVARFTGRFGAAEFTATAALALLCVAKAYRGQFAAAMMMLGIGLFAGTVGIDQISNEQRFTFGHANLLTGIPLVPVIIGLFGIAQALVLLSTRHTGLKATMPRPGLSFRAFLEPFHYPGTLTKSTLIGTVIGILPAVGAALSTTLSYFEARRSSKHPERFGQGSPEGIIAAEAANNSNSGGAMGTVLTLGIPGDAVTAIIMGVFIVHGVYPGPQLFVDKPELAYGIFASLIWINLAILALLLVLTPTLALFVRVDERILGVVILALCFVGAYSVATSFYGVGIALAAGIFGLVCAWLRIPVIPAALGMVMGDFLESSLRQTLTISGGSFGIFFERPIAAVLVAIMVVMLVWPWLQPLLKGLMPARWRVGLLRAGATNDLTIGD